jgi:DNA-binding transcriptional LysR family regulator
MDQLDAMRNFVAIAERGSLSAAARALAAPVASVSRKLAALERHVGVRLVARSTRKIALTAAGERYLGRAREILAAVALADAESAGSAGTLVDTLSVSAPVAFGRLHVLPIVCELLGENPRIDVCLQLDDRNVDLIEERVDVAVRIGPLADSALTAARVGAVRRVVCASPAYLAAHGTPDTPEDLGSHACLAGTTLGRGDRWLFDGGRRVAVRARLGVTSNEAVVDAAIAGLGIARVLSYQAAAALESGALVRILERFEPAPLPVQLIHGEGRSARPALRAFVGLASKRLRARLRE